MRKLYKIHKSSLTRHKVKSQKELWERLQAKGYNGMLMESETELKKDKGDNNKFHAVFSNESVDRHGDIVIQDWKLTSFKKNPVYLDSHNYDSIEHIIGKVINIKVKDKQLVGDIEFNLANPKGRMARDMAENGYLNTSSVGFIPLDFSNKGEITKSELLEISGVSVPANPEALIEKNNKTNKKEYDKENNTDTSGENKSDSEENDKQPSDSEEERKESKEDDKDKESEEVKEDKEDKTSEAIKNVNPDTHKLERAIKQAIESELEKKERALKRILTAIELVASETKGRASNGNSQAINNKINKAVRVLLKLKNKD